MARSVNYYQKIIDLVQNLPTDVKNKLEVVNKKSKDEKNFEILFKIDDIIFHYKSWLLAGEFPIQALYSETEVKKNPVTDGPPIISGLNYNNNVFTLIDDEKMKKLYQAMKEIYV